MKKIITILCLVVICFYHINPVLAANTKSISLSEPSSQYLGITDGAQTGLDLSGSFTFEVWLKPGTSNSFALVDKWVGPSDQRSYQIVYHFGYEKWYFDISENGTSADTRLELADTSIATGEWQHYAFTFNSSDSKIILYRNGSSLVNGTHPSSSIYNSGSPVFLFGTDYYNGLADEYIIWDDVRTPTEISESYNSGNGKIYVGDEANMVAYWRYEDNLLDLTSNDNDLTNNNSATFSVDVPFSGAVSRRIINIE